MTVPIEGERRIGKAVTTVLGNGVVCEGEDAEDWRRTKYSGMECTMTSPLLWYVYRALSHTVWCSRARLLFAASNALLQ